MMRTLAGHGPTMMLVGILSLAIRPWAAVRGDERTAARTISNEYIAARMDGHRLISLRFDPTGNGRFSQETIAAGGALAGFKTLDLQNDTLVLAGPEAELVWDLPFERAGYYDADQNINYPSPFDTDGAAPLTLPFRRFVTSAGQYVNLECFKRLPLGPCMHPLNVADGSQLLLVGNARQNHDLKLTCPGQDAIPCEVAEHHLRIKPRLSDGRITIQVLPPETEAAPGDRVALPSVRFEPDFPIRFTPTGKTASASNLMTDLVRTGIYWHPSMIAVGDWGLGAVGTHMMDDPRSWYLRHLRSQLLKMIAWIGYDRFEHFGMMFAWGRYPDYGAGGLLNLPPSNAPYDMRMLHLNGQWIVTIAQYVLATGDIDLLRSRRTRWLGTDGKQPQPICGKNATCADFVLAAGDVRLDARKPRKVHTLSQTFRASKPFSTIRLRLGSDSRTETATGWMELRTKDTDKPAARIPFTLEPNRHEPVEFHLPQQAPAGTYRVEIGDDDSGKRYFGPGIYWLTDPESSETVPPAGSGPFSGTLYDRLTLLFDYIVEHTGAGKGHLFHYINDPEYNIPDHKSGRPRVCTENSYWEAAGGGYDAFEGLWYNAACRAMGEMAELMNDRTAVTRYRDLAAQADRAYNAKYWHTAIDNEQPFQRYLACEDWDGRTYDYGFTYYNLEAAVRRIPSDDQTRAILWWLDRGQYSPDEGKTWNEDIYSIWGLAPPFNTIANNTWINVTGTLPYREVLVNGGTRPPIAGRDVLARSRCLGADNMHERNCRILARFANPDRLTGGRTFNDPGGRGRWHWGQPNTDRADIEGFREIFPQNGDMVTCQIMAYLGMDYSAEGLWLKPRVPSDLDRMTFRNLGYAGALFDFEVEAMRKEVRTVPIKTSDRLAFEFRADEPFNKAGVRIGIRPPILLPNNQLTLTLEHKEGPHWQPTAKTWYSHVRDGQTLWIAAERWLPPAEYRLSISDVRTAADQTMQAGQGQNSPPIRCVAERTRLVINVADQPHHAPFRIEGESVHAPTNSCLEAVMAPGQRIRLTYH